MLLVFLMHERIQGLVIENISLWLLYQNIQKTFLVKINLGRLYCSRRE
jgi:hypothetical protein